MGCFDVREKTRECFRVAVSRGGCFRLERRGPSDRIRPETPESVDPAAQGMETVLDMHAGMFVLYLLGMYRPPPVPPPDDPTGEPVEQDPFFAIAAFRVTPGAQGGIGALDQPSAVYDLSQLGFDTEEPMARLMGEENIRAVDMSLALSVPNRGVWLFGVSLHSIHHTAYLPSHDLPRWRDYFIEGGWVDGLLPDGSRTEGITRCLIDPPGDCDKWETPDYLDSVYYGPDRSGAEATTALSLWNNETPVTAPGDGQKLFAYGSHRDFYLGSGARYIMGDYFIGDEIVADVVITRYEDEEGNTVCSCRPAPRFNNKLPPGESAQCLVGYDGTWLVWFDGVSVIKAINLPSGQVVTLLESSGDVHHVCYTVANGWLLWRDSFGLLPGGQPNTEIHQMRIE